MLAEAQATASSELENLRSAHKDLESKLNEAEEKRELAENQLAEKNSEFIREKADLVEKRRKDSATPKNLRDEVQTLRTYMRTAEQGWDLLNSDVMARAPTLNIEVATAGIPPDADPNALLDACSGYDTRIARRIRHGEFYDKVVLPADEPLEAELDKVREAEARPPRSEDGSQFTWTSSKEAEKNGTKKDDETLLLRLRKRKRARPKLKMKFLLLQSKRSENLLLRESYKHFIILAPLRVCNIT
ncbi:hypothetical protein QYE76_055163 [Lolium multiflorum]|uniref:Uncharacterized protein n=1 Tax=Lolium multiflorum TaxID=4521 RepID=A0AAD8T086_LOLMU|nr:hypothetical protein QYE76_055163 [Lolium multiflorum]